MKIKKVCEKIIPETLLRFVKKNIKTYMEKKQFNRFLIQSDNRFDVDWKDRYLCLNDIGPTTGFDRHYLYHTAWAARILAKSKPEEHVDISSDLRFVTSVSAFIPIKFYDYRPAKIELSNLQCDHADITKLPFNDNSINSLSCMHVVEHVGLGRYGDPLDPQGDIKGMKELVRVLAENGDLLFVVPIGGKAIIMFNAHRIYTKNMILEQFGQLGLKLKQFVLIPESENDGGLVENPSDELVNKQKYGCGCFWFTKIK